MNEWKVTFKISILELFSRESQQDGN